MKKKFGSSPKKSKAALGKVLAAMSGIGSLPPPPDQMPPSAPPMADPPGAPPGGPPAAPPGMKKGGKVKSDHDADDMFKGGRVKLATGGSVSKGMGMASRGGSYKSC